MKKRLLLPLIAGVLLIFTCITASAAAADTTPDVPISVIQVVSVAIKSAPVKTDYYVGEELDLSGGKLELTLTNREKKIVDMEAVWCSGFFNTVENTSTVSVQYPEGGNAVSFKVNVKNKAAKSIKIASKPTHLSYFRGDSLNSEGLVVNAEFGDGTFSDVTSACSFSDTDMNTPGKKTVYVYYYAEGQRYEAEFEINVLDIQASALEIVTLPELTEYYDGDTPDFSGISIRVTFTNGTSTIRRVYTDLSLMTFSGFDPYTLGEQEISVTFEDVTASFNVLVMLSPEHEHTAGTETVIKEPTCTEDGVKTAVCRVCGEEMGEMPTGLAAHSWSDWVVVQFATEISRGKMERTCSVCGTVDTAVIPSLNEDTTAAETSVPDTPDESSSDEPETSVTPEETSAAELTTAEWTPITTVPVETNPVDAGGSSVTVIVIIIVIVILTVGGLVAALCYKQYL